MNASLKPSINPPTTTPSRDKFYKLLHLLLPGGGGRCLYDAVFITNEKKNKIKTVFGSLIWK